MALFSRRPKPADAEATPVAPAADTLPEIRAAARSLLPGARIRRRLVCRYTLVWELDDPV